jgi:hypothetical protein
MKALQILALFLTGCGSIPVKIHAPPAPCPACTPVPTPATQHIHASRHGFHIEIGKRF